MATRDFKSSLTRSLCHALSPRCGVSCRCLKVHCIHTKLRCWLIVRSHPPTVVEQHSVVPKCSAVVLCHGCAGLFVVVHFDDDDDDNDSTVSLCQGKYALVAHSLRWLVGWLVG